MPSRLMDERTVASSSPEHGAAAAGELSSGRASAVPIEPDEIRAIRKRLGLSQAEAGELLGGGPRAFTKYETGTVRPAAAVVTLLRLLERNPSLIGQLHDSKSSPTPSLVPLPFEIGGEHIEHINETLFPKLLRRLLHAEACTHGVPIDGIHVAGNTKARDGGEDGRIEWRGGADRTPNLPCRLNQFQLKAGDVKPAQAGKDVVRGGKVQPMVGAVLEAGGHYRLLCTRRYTRQAIENRVQRIREALRGTGVLIDDGQITVWDADQIADWVNQHPAVAIWAKERTQLGTVGPFRSWTYWARHPDHDNSPWVPDERLSKLRDRMRELERLQRILRLVGLSGIGKSRLALEALGPMEGERALSDIVMYADESQANPRDIFQAVDALVDTASRAIVVINRCSPKVHRTLGGKISRAGSRLSLLTIDDEVPATSFDEATIKIEDAPPSVVEAIIHNAAPKLPPEDRRRLEHFSEGFPRIAIDVLKAWEFSQPIAHAQDDDIVNAFVLGRDPGDSERTLKSAMLLAAFGIVAVEGDGQLNEVATFHQDISAEDLRIGINRLVDRGVVRGKGRLRVLQPRPIAMRLAERQWREWSGDQWGRLLTSDEGRHLRVLRATAARALARLNTTSIAEEVVRYVCRPNGPDIPKDMWPTLAEVAPEVVLRRLEDILSRDDDLSDDSGNGKGLNEERTMRGNEAIAPATHQLVGGISRDVVSALERIVFHPDTFDRGARLLLRLAAAYPETHASGAFVGLFRAHLGNTAADDKARLTFLDEVICSAAGAERSIVVDALIESLATTGWRVVGAEVQGSKPALSPWRPTTKDEEIGYVTGCLSRLASIAAQVGTSWPIGRARSGLGERLRSWVGRHYMDALERVVCQVSSVVGAWPEAIEGLGHALKYDADKHSPEVVRRVKALLCRLRPTKLEDRIHFLVTAMPWDYPADKRLDFDDLEKMQEDAIRDLTLDLARTPQILEAALPQLSRGQPRKAFVFGKALGEIPGQFKPHVWRRRISQAALDVPEAERNLDLLSGYFVGISKSCLRLTMPLKKRLVQSEALAPEFLRVCSFLGVEGPDLGLAVNALERRVLAPTALLQWTFGNPLRNFPPSELVPLFDALLADEGDDALAVALKLIAAYSFVDPEKLDGLRLQMHKCFVRCAHGDNWPAAAVEQLAGWMLAKGRQDAGARATALDLATIMVERPRTLPSTLTCKLLSDFPEVVWPCVGAAIVADRRLASYMGLTLGMGPRRDERPIVRLPVETLFSWCRAHPNTAPAFAASVLPVLATQGDEKTLHPTLCRLIDEFGEREDVLSAIERNIGTYSWVGSMAGYYRQYVGPLGALAGHRVPAVRYWAARTIRELQTSIENARHDDEELYAEWEL